MVGSGEGEGVTIAVVDDSRQWSGVVLREDEIYAGNYIW